MHSKAHASAFEFLSRTFETDSGDLTFTYKVHFSDAQPLVFTEQIHLKDAEGLERLDPLLVQAFLEDLHLVLGVSYYKLFCPPQFQTDIMLSNEQASFWNTLYTDGLGEFLYRNAIDPKTIAQFTGGGEGRMVHTLDTDADSLLVGIGGGKDSIVSLELLRDFKRTGFVVETGKENGIAQEVAAIADVPLTSISRTLDPQLIAGVPGSYGGHVPISAVYAFLGVLECAMNGHAYMVVSNEYSSNFGNLMHEGNEVNHQWSKSQTFERLFASYVATSLTDSVRYFSLLRPFYELRIVRMFTQLGRAYFQTFSSCNRNFTHHHDGASRWCGECPKCAFAYLMLSSFLTKDELVQIFKKDLFADTALESLFTDLLGYGTLKPFDCVGTFDESRVALASVHESHRDSYIVQKLTALLAGETLNDEVFKVQKADTVPSRFRMYGMESALVLGYGKEGRATETFLKKTCPEVRIGVADAKDGEEYLKKQHDFDITIKTPGLPQDRIVRQSTTATQLFFSIVPKDQIIGITGSKGKSTTATLIHLLLKASDVHVHLIGNIGVPALQHLEETPFNEDDVFVYELSSYQLEDLDTSPHIAVVTSLFPEHIDHHGSLEAYYAAKRNILRYQTSHDIAVHALGFPQLEEWIHASRAQCIEEETVPFVVTAPALRGDHMRSNVALAYTIGKLFGVSDASAEEVINTFQGLPHRLQKIGEYDGIEFYDDSISTTPESAIAGLRALQNVDTIILGGVDRGYRFEALEAELRAQGVRNIVLFPESGEHMLQSEEGFTILHTSSMDEAVRFAYMHTQKGKACLLSPAAPSYNLFANFEARGDAFALAVKNTAK